jgi:methyltransferase
VVSVPVYLALVALVALERLLEVVVSKRNARRLAARGGVVAARGHLAAMSALHVLFLVSCAAEVLFFSRDLSPRLASGSGLPALGSAEGSGGARFASRNFPEAIGVIALSGVVLAQAMRWWTVRVLGDRWTLPVLVLPGSSPVTGGPYRFVRHPNYAAVFLELAALPLVRGAWITAVVFSLANALHLARRIPAEEAALGPEYARAFADRPRFLPVPRWSAP